MLDRGHLLYLLVATQPLERHPRLGQHSRQRHGKQQQQQQQLK